MITYQNIKREIQHGEIEEAIRKAILKAKEVGNSRQKRELVALSAQFQKFQGEKFMGLKPDASIGNRIDLALLTIIEAMERSSNLNRKPNLPKGKEENYFIGKIKYINNHQRYGFVKSNSLQHDVFFHFSSIVQNKLPIISQRVKFEINKNEKGWFAENMSLIDSRKKRKKKRRGQSKSLSSDLKLALLEDDIKTTIQKIMKLVKHYLNKFF